MGEKKKKRIAKYRYFPIRWQDGVICLSLPRLDICTEILKIKTFKNWSIKAFPQKSHIYPPPFLWYVIMFFAPILCSYLSRRVPYLMEMDIEIFSSEANQEVVVPIIQASSKEHEQIRHQEKGK